jgi:hypothetical protein
LQRDLETVLGRRIVAGEVTDQSRVIVDFDGSRLELRSEPLAAGA